MMAENSESKHLANTLIKYASVMPKTTVKRLSKHWGILRFRTGGKTSYTITLDGSYVGKAIRKGDVWRATKLRSSKDLFREYEMVVQHRKLYDLIEFCAEVERVVIQPLKNHKKTS